MLITILRESLVILLLIFLSNIEILKTIFNSKKIKVNIYKLFITRIKLIACRTSNQNYYKTTLIFKTNKKKQELILSKLQ